MVKSGQGRGQFKAGSTIPVKFRLNNGSLVTNATGTVCINSNCASFRWDATSSQYIANLSTKGLAAGAYTIVLNVTGVANGPFSLASVQLK